VSNKNNQFTPKSTDKITFTDLTIADEYFLLIKGNRIKGTASRLIDFKVAQIILQMKSGMRKTQYITWGIQCFLL
jgi:hypothetical protein